MKHKFIWIIVLICLSVSTSFGAFSTIPKGLTVHVDDTGWKRPPRLLGPGATYEPQFSDYETLINVGINVKIRFTSLWCLSDFDRNNICAKAEYNCPVAPSNVVEDGVNWDCTSLMRSNDFTLMDYIKDNAAYHEFGLHGPDAWHWNCDGSAECCEFAESDVQASWGWADMTTKLKCYEELLRQYYDVSESSFPVHFVPPNHGYFYQAGNNQTTGAAVHSYGIKYASFDTGGTTNIGEYTIDNGLLVVHRPWQGVSYNEIGRHPPGYPYGPYGSAFVIESHFPNWFGAETIWTDFLRNANNASDIYLAKNTVQAFSQWLYRKFATVNDAGGTVTINNTGMLDDVYTNDLLGPLILKTLLGGQHISSASIDKDAQIVGYYEDDFGNGYLLIGHKTNARGRLSKDTYTLTYTLGSSYMPAYIDITDATFCVHSFESGVDSAVTNLEMYGTQDLKIKVQFAPAYVGSDNPNLTVNSWDYQVPFVTVNLTGKNIQGETGTVTVSGAAPEPTKVMVSANPTILQADGSSTSQIEARVCDANDNTVTNSTAEITFTLTGTGSLIGSNPINASAGIATITYRAGISEQTVTVTATSSGLTQGTVNINLVANNPPDAPTNLLCNNQPDPTGLADLTPDLSWTFSDPDNGDTQTAYRILVADSQSSLDSDNGNMWDSTKVPSAANNSATYEGTSLSGNTMYYWKVMTWDSFDASSPYSQTGTFTTANTDPRAFHGIPMGIPGKIEIEDFDIGGEGVAYHDTTSGNSGNASYRSGESVDISDDQEIVGGYIVSGNPQGEWLEYTVDVTQTGTYTIEVYVGATNLGGTFHIEFGGVDKTDFLQVPDTGSGGCWNRQTISKTGVSLSQGRQIMRLEIDSNHSQWNDYSGCMDYINVTLEGQVTPTITITSPNGGETWTANAQAAVTWTSAGTVGNAVGIALSTDGGSNWSTLASGTANDGAESVTVPNSQSTTCRIRVRDISGTPNDISNSNFTINPGVTPPSISVNPTSLDFGNVEIGKTSILDFTITNTGGGILSGSISSDKKWIDVQPTSFEGNTTIVNVTVDNDILNENVGQHTGKVDITSNGGNISVEVTLVATCVLAKPNPYDPSKGNLTFFGDGIVPGVPGGTTIKIYTLSGELVSICHSRPARESNSINGFPDVTSGNDIVWNGKNENGIEVISGVYIYIYESPKEKGVGKFTIIRK